MRSLYLLPAVLMFPFYANAAINCKPKAGQDPGKSAANFEFHCGKGIKSFSAVCDVTSDPLEGGKGWVDVKAAKWMQHGDKQGIEGKFGFIVCSKK